MFENASALSLLLILLPVILLYLLKPKPRTIKIPSLILLSSFYKKRKLISLFDRLIKDPLLLIQLIILTILVLGIADPYYTSISGYDTTIIVLDASASMSATDVKPDRFSKAVEIAREYTEKSDKNTLILAQNVPVLVFRDETGKTAADELSKLKPKATGTDLKEAMMFALDMIEKNRTRLVIISDFSGHDIQDVRKIIELRNIPFEYRQTGAGGSNIGIVDGIIEENELKIVVRNYDNVQKDVILKIVNDDAAGSIERTIKPESREFYTVTNINSGTTEISIEQPDDLLTDNTFFLSMPDSRNRHVLMISDSSGENKPVYLAFKSIPNIDIEEVPFERAPRKPDHGMIVIYDYSNSSFLPGTMNDIKEYSNNGGTVVFIADEALPFIDTEGLLPVRVSGLARPSKIDTRNSELTDDIDFGISGYLKGTTKEGAIELASAKEGPILSYWNIGRGKVVYVGTNEKWSNFHLQVSYPIFWYGILKFANTGEDELNFKSGTLLPLGKVKTVKGPYQTLRTDKLYLEDAGFYDIEEETIASNLLDEKESDISIPVMDFNESNASGNISAGDIEHTHLHTILSTLAIILVALELYYLKYRGDI